MSRTAAAAAGGRVTEKPTVVVGVGIDPAALADTFGGDKALRRVTHEELLDDLVLHGTLVFSSPEEVDAFAAQVKQLPPLLSKRWRF